MAQKTVKLKTLDDLIRLWPSEAEFARDIDLKPSHVAVFKCRKNIPSHPYWKRIIAAADLRGFDSVTADALLNIQSHMAKTT